MKNVYLASAYETKQQIRQYARIMNACGFTVTSTWHEQEEPASGNQGLGPADLNERPEVGRPYALADLRDIDAADTLILFTDGSGRGGRHFETGYAWASGKGIVIIGNRLHVFHTLPGIDYWEDFTTYVANFPVIYPVEE